MSENNSKEIVVQSDETNITAQFLEELLNDDDKLTDIRESSVGEVVEKYKCTRQEARSVIKFAHEQDEQDHLAFAPSGPEYLEARVDTGIRAELNRLLYQQSELEAIIRKANESGAGRDQKYARKSGVPLTSAEAKDILSEVFGKLLEIKKTLAASAKGKAPTGANVEINLGSLMSDIINNIRGKE